MGKSRFLKGNLLMIAIFLIEWHFGVTYKIEEYLHGSAASFSWKEMFSWIYEPMESHLGVRTVIFFYNTAFLLIVQYILSEQSEAWYVRQKKRENIAWKYFRVVLLEAVCFAVVCEMVDCAGMYWNYPDRSLLNGDFCFASVGHMLCMALFFLRSGIILLIIRCMLAKKLAPYFVEVLFILEYLYRYQLLGIKIRPDSASLWAPIADVAVKLDIYFGSLTRRGLTIILARDLGFVCIVGFIYFTVFRKKDLIENEKA